MFKALGLGSQAYVQGLGLMFRVFGKGFRRQDFGLSGLRFRA